MRRAFVPEISALQVKLMRFGIIRRANCDGMLFRAGQLCLQRVGYFCRNFAFDGKNVGKMSVVRLRPQVCIVRGIDQLDRHPNSVGGFLHAAFKEVRHPQPPGNLRQIVGRTFVTLSRGA